MKLGIIGGAGLLGSTTAFYVAINSLVDEIVLYDVRENYALNHAMDMEHAVCDFSATVITSGDFAALEGSDIILNTAGVPESHRASRDDYIEDNLPIYKDIADKIKSWGYFPVIISTSNPVDPLNFKLHEFIGGPRNRYLGLSYNDTLRFKWSVAKELGFPSTLIDGIVLGEHGSYAVPIFTSLKRKDTGEAITLTEQQRQSVKNRPLEWFKDLMSLKTTRTMGWTSGLWLGKIVEAIVNESDTIFPCSCIPEGEYGLSEVSLALPLKLGKEGFREIVEIPLDESEQQALNEASDKIKSLIAKTY